MIDVSLFVTLEGIDAAGKSTLRNQFVAHGSTHFTRPIVTAGEFDSPIGQILRTSLQGLSAFEKVYLFAADRVWTLTNLQRSQLDPATVLVWDRYVDSAVCYRQAEVEIGEAPGEVIDLVRRINSPLLVPDLTLLIDVPPEVASHRIKEKDGTAPNAAVVAKLEIVRQCYLKLAAEAQDRIAVVDGTEASDRVFAHCVQLISEAIG
jgi:dTMP kinase